MIDYLKYRYKIGILNDSRLKTEEAYCRKIKKAREQKKSHEEIESLERDEIFELVMIKEEISILITGYLIKKANKWFVPIPGYNEEKMWEKCNAISDQKVLTTMGINTVKQAIRNELKGRIELFIMVAAALTGIIGALTGLIAVIK